MCPAKQVHVSPTPQNPWPLHCFGHDPCTPSQSKTNATAQRRPSPRGRDRPAHGRVRGPAGGTSVPGRRRSRRRCCCCVQRVSDRADSLVLREDMGATPIAVMGGGKVVPTAGLQRCGSAGAEARRSGGAEVRASWARNPLRFKPISYKTHFDNSVKYEKSKPHGLH